MNKESTYTTCMQVTKSLWKRAITKRITLNLLTTVTAAGRFDDDDLVFWNENDNECNTKVYISALICFIKQ